MGCCAPVIGKVSFLVVQIRPSHANDVWEVDEARRVGVAQAGQEVKVDALIA